MALVPEGLEGYEVRDIVVDAFKAVLETLLFDAKGLVPTVIVGDLIGDFTKFACNLVFSSIYSEEK